MNSKKQNKKAQILVVTLLVLMVMAVVVIGVAVLLNRDTQQVVNNQKYQQIYNVSENNLRNFLENYAASANLSETSSEGCTENNVTSQETSYLCSLNNQVGDAGINITTELELIDSKDIINIPVEKDESFDIVLNNYKNDLDFSWDKDIALEFMLTYYPDTNGNSVQDTNEAFAVVKDYFDPYAIYTSGNTNPYNTISSTFDFEVNDAGNQNNTVTVCLACIDVPTSAATNFTPVLLTITPRYSSADGIPTVFNITPQSYAGYPYQIRNFISTSYDNEDTATPVVKTGAFIPLSPQLDPIFDYVLLSDNEI